MFDGQQPPSHFFFTAPLESMFRGIVRPSMQTTDEDITIYEGHVCDANYIKTQSEILIDRYESQVWGSADNLHSCLENNTRVYDRSQRFSI